MTQQIDLSMRDAKSFGEMVGPIRRHLITFVVIVLACTAAGFLYVARMPTKYDAKTTVLVTDTGVANTTTGNGKNVINLDTEAQVVVSDAVLSEAIKALKLDGTSEDLGKHVSVTVPPNTDILSLVVTANTAAEAVREAAGVANAYLSNRNATAGQLRDAESKANSERSASLQDQANKISAQIVDAKNSNDDAARTLLQASYKRIQDQISSIAETNNDLQLQVISGGRVLTPATANPSGSNVTKLLGLVSGVALGLFLGFGAATVLDRLRRRIRTAGEVARITDLPMLVRKPIVLNQYSDLDPSLPPHAPQIGKIFTRLRNELDRSSESSRVVLVTGVGAQTAHAVAVRLAHTYRRGGRRVALVDRFNWMDDSSSSGSLGSDGNETDLAVKALNTINDLAADTGADAIVILGPDFASSADAQTLATHADIVLLIVQRGVTKISDLRDAEAQLSAVHARSYVVMTTAASSGALSRVGTMISEPRHDYSRPSPAERSNGNGNGNGATNGADYGMGPEVEPDLSEPAPTAARSRGPKASGGPGTIPSGLALRGLPRSGGHDAATSGGLNGAGRKSGPAVAVETDAERPDSSVTEK